MKIIYPKLVPFCRKLLQRFSWVQVVEKNAGAHASHYNIKLWELLDIMRIEWPGNSPGLNAIEPIWFRMKRETTKKGPINSSKELQELWVKCWEEMPQEKIQAWIERIPRHIKEVIRCEGNNLYQEGRLRGKEKKRIH